MRVLGRDGIWVEVDVLLMRWRQCPEVAGRCVSASSCEEVLTKLCTLSATASARMALVRVSAVAPSIWPCCCAVCTTVMQLTGFETEIFVGVRAAVTTSNERGGRERGRVIWFGFFV